MDPKQPEQPEQAKQAKELQAKQAKQLRELQEREELDQLEAAVRKNNERRRQEQAAKEAAEAEADIEKISIIRSQLSYQPNQPNLQSLCAFRTSMIKFIDASSTLMKGLANNNFTKITESKIQALTNQAAPLLKKKVLLQRLDFYNTQSEIRKQFHDALDLRIKLEAARINVVNLISAGKDSRTISGIFRECEVLEQRITESVANIAGKAAEDFYGRMFKTYLETEKVFVLKASVIEGYMWHLILGSESAHYSASSGLSVVRKGGHAFLVAFRNAVTLYNKKVTENCLIVSHNAFQVPDIIDHRSEPVSYEHFLDIFLMYYAMIDGAIPEFLQDIAETQGIDPLHFGFNTPVVTETTTPMTTQQIAALHGQYASANTAAIAQAYHEDEDDLATSTITGQVMTRLEEASQNQQHQQHASATTASAAQAEFSSTSLTPSMATLSAQAHQGPVSNISSYTAVQQQQHAPAAIAQAHHDDEDDLATSTITGQVMTRLEEASQNQQHQQHASATTASAAQAEFSSTSLTPSMATLSAQAHQGLASNVQSHVGHNVQLVGGIGSSIQEHPYLASFVTALLGATIVPAAHMAWDVVNQMCQDDENSPLHYICGLFNDY